MTVEEELQLWTLLNELAEGNLALWRRVETLERALLDQQVLAPTILTLTRDQIAHEERGAPEASLRARIDAILQAVQSRPH